MKLLRILVIMLSFIYFSHATEMMPRPQHPVKIPPFNVMFEQNIPDGKHQLNRLQASQAIIIDSSANAYAYIGQNNPFMYDPVSNKLVIIRRGFVDKLKNTIYTGKDQKNNLFIKSSSDWGKTWSASVMVYDEDYFKMDQARYPAIALFQLDGELAVAFTASTVLEKQSKWTGIITGYWSEGQGNFAMKSDSTFKSTNNNVYQWGTISNLVAKNFGSGEFTVMAADPVQSFVKDLKDANNIGLRTTDYSKVICSIPTAWESSNFKPSPQADSRYNELIGFVTAGGKEYMASYGGYVNTTDTTRNTVGFSSSSDNGATWSSYNIMPYSLIQDYAMTQGAISRDSVGGLGWGSKGFTVLDNGDVSITAEIYFKIGTEWHYHIVEMYYENKAWGVRKVAVVGGSYLIYRDYLVQNTASNPLDIEIQTSRTPDGKHLVTKWVDIVFRRDTVINGTSRQLFSTDVFMSSREVGVAGWSSKQNATINNGILDHVTLIPNYVPNDLQNIPIISNVAITGVNDSLTTPMYIVLQSYNHVVGVEETGEKTDFRVNNIYPNPADYTSNIDFSIEKAGNVEISIINLLGQTVKTVYSGYQTEGVHSVNFLTDEIPAGTYSIAVKMNGFVKSGLINIVR